MTRLTIPCKSRRNHRPHRRPKTWRPSRWSMGTLCTCGHLAGLHADLGNHDWCATCGCTVIINTNQRRTLVPR